MKPMTRVSPTQIKMWLECPRKWFYSYVLQQKQPPTEALKVGTAVHSHLERWLLGEPEERDQYWPLALAIMESGYIEPGPHIIGVELATTKRSPIGFGDTGVTLNGRIDVVERREDGGLVITDFKTTSAKKWVKSEEELKQDIQALCYGRWASLAFSGCNPTTPLTFRLIYVNKKTRAVYEVRTEITLRELHNGWTRFTEIVKEMKAAKSPATDIVNIRPDRSACSNYGGCHVLRTCTYVPYQQDGQSAPSPFTGVNPMASETRKSLKEILAEKKARAAQESGESEPAPKPMSRLEQIKAAKAARIAEKAANFGGNGSTEPEGFTEAATEPEENAWLNREDERALAQIESEGPAVIAPDAPEDMGPVPIRQRPLNQLGLTGRAKGSLERFGLETAGDLLDYVDQGNKLKDIKGCGGKTQAEVENLIEDIRANLGIVAQDEPPAEPVTVRDEITRIVAEGTKKPKAPATPEEKIGKAMAEEIIDHVLTKASAGLGEMMLLVDCYPQGIDAKPLVSELRALALDCGAGETEYYNLAPYAEGPRKLAALVLQNMDRFQGMAWLVDSRHPATPYVMEVLEPVADVVIRGMR